MSRLLLALTLSFWLTACNSETGPTIEAPAANYKITKDEKRPNIKRSVEVVLPNKINKAELEKIAKFIEHSDANSYERTFIGYFISGDAPNNGYWATTHFNPNLKVEILGLSIEKESAMFEKPAVSSSKNMLGTWVDDRPYVGSRIELYQLDDSLMIKRTFSDGSSSNKEMKSNKEKRGLHIEDIDGNSFGEYYILNAQGELEFWSENSNYYTAKEFSK